MTARQGFTPAPPGLRTCARRSSSSSSSRGARASRSRASYGLGVELGGCRWHRTFLIAATGQTWSVDCGGVGEGSLTLVLSTDTGALSGRAEVVGVLCDAKLGACPPPHPTPTQ